MNEWQAQKSYTLSIESGECAALVAGAFYSRDPDNDEQASKQSDLESFQQPRPTVLAVMANETDIRMFIQQGAFTIHEWSPLTLDDLPGAELVLERLVIPAAAVDSFAAEIDLCGFVEGDIYPNLEHLSHELTRLLQ